MDDKTTKDPAVEIADFEKTDFQPKLSKEQEQAEKLQSLLSNIQQGWKISIAREQPSWCRGHLETIEVYDPSEPFDIDYLIRTWGGQRLHAKVHDESGRWIGGGSISLFSYAPKVHGKEIKESDYFAQSSAALPPMPHPYQNPPPAQQLDLKTLVEILRSGKKSELDLALKILDRAPAPAPAPVVQKQSSPMEQMLSMFQMFGQMKDLFGDMSGSSSGGDSESLTPIIGDLVKGLMSGQQNIQNDPRKPALVAPRAPGRPGGAPGPAPVHQVPPLRPVEGLGEDNLSQIADKLSALSSNDAVDVLIQALGNMPEDKRAESMQLFFEGISGQNELDGLSNEDDNLEEDDQEGNGEHAGIADHKSSNQGK